MVTQNSFCIKSILTILCLLSQVSCKVDTQINEKPETIISLETSQIIQEKKVTIDSLKLEEVFKRFQTLYSELHGFKNNPDFVKYGFSVGGPYHSWLKRTEALRDDNNSKLLIHKGVLAGELLQLGMSYVFSKGKETETTEFYNKAFTEALRNK